MNDPRSLLEKAQECYFRSDWTGALDAISTFRATAPSNLESLVLEARVRRRIGESAAADRLARQAMMLGSGDDVAALHEFLMQRVSAAEWGVWDPVTGDSTEELLQATLARVRGTHNDRWYCGKLMMLQGLAHLARGALSAANQCIAEAIRRDGPHLREDEFLFPWVVEALAVAGNLSGHDALRCLEWRSRTPVKPLPYHDELAKLEDEAFVLEIGAMDGVGSDPLRESLVARRWQALLIEPIEPMFELLLKNCADYPNIRCLNVAISNKTGMGIMHYVHPKEVAAGKIEEWALGISSFNQSPYYCEHMSKDHVMMLTFDDLIRQEKIQRIDVLQMDVEGHEAVIFRQIDLDRWKIGIFFIEFCWLTASDRMYIIDSLERHGYTLKASNEDLLAVRDDVPDCQSE